MVNLKSKNIDQNAKDNVDETIDQAYAGNEGHADFAEGNDDFGAGFDIMSKLSAYTASPIDIDIGNERTNKVLEGLTAALDYFKSRGKVQVDIIGLFEVDGAKHGLTFSSVVAYYVQRNAQGAPARASYAVMLVESDRSIEPQQTTSLDGRPLELPRGALDAFNDRYDQAVIQGLANALAKEGIQLSPKNFVFAGASVLYKEVDLSETPKFAQLLSALASQAVSPLTNSTIADTNKRGTFVDVIRKGDYRLEASLQHKPNIVDLNDTPVLADLLIRTKAIENMRGGGNDLNQSDVQVLAEVGVAMELEYHKIKEQVAQPQGYYSQPVAKPHEYNYVGTLIITHIAQQGQLTLDRLLLAISTTIIAHDPRLWMDMLRPKAMGQAHNSQAVVPLAGIEAIGYDIPDEDGNLTPLPVQSEEYTGDNHAVLFGVIGSNIYPDLGTCIDIPESVLGARPIKDFEKTGLTVSNAVQPTEALQIQQERRAQAIQTACDNVIRTLDNMTDNVFSTLFPETSPILLPDPIMIPMGYWIDQSGNKRDLREFNYLAARAYSGRREDDNFMMRWESTFKSTPGEEATDCAERIVLIREMAGNCEIFIKGYAWRYIVDPAFIAASGQATVQANVSPTYNSLTPKDQRKLRGEDGRVAAHLLPHARANAYAAKTIHTRPQQSSRPRFNRGENRW